MAMFRIPHWALPLANQAPTQNHNRFIGLNNSPDRLLDKPQGTWAKIGIAMVGLVALLFNRQPYVDLLVHGAPKSAARLVLRLGAPMGLRRRVASAGSLSDPRSPTPLADTRAVAVSRCRRGTAAAVFLDRLKARPIAIRIQAPIGSVAMMRPRLTRFVPTNVMAIRYTLCSPGPWVRTPTIWWAEYSLEIVSYEWQLESIATWPMHPSEQAARFGQIHPPNSASSSPTKPRNGPRW